MTTNRDAYQQFLDILEENDSQLARLREKVDVLLSYSDPSVPVEEAKRFGRWTWYHPQSVNPRRHECPQCRAKPDQNCLNGYDRLIYPRDGHGFGMGVHATRLAVALVLLP